MKLSFSTFYNTNCFWEFRRPSPLSSRAKSQGRFEGMCMSCRPVDIHPVEGNKLKAKLCCLVSPMLLLLSAFFLASQLLRFNALLCVKCFHFAFCLFFPPPTAACLQSDVVKSTFISGNATTSPSLFAIWHLISLFFRSISYFLPCFIFLLGFLSKHGLLLVFGFWFLVFVCATTSATYRFTGTMTQKRVYKGVESHERPYIQGKFNLEAWTGNSWSIFVETLNLRCHWQSINAEC